MSTFFKRLFSAIILASVSIAGLYFFPIIFLMGITLFALYELNSHFKVSLWYIFIPYSILILMGMLSFGYILTYHNWQYITWMVLVTCSADTFAYFTGSIIGGPKLCPSISPGKTISGVCGGTLFALAIGLSFSAYYNMHLGPMITLAIIASSILGDLLESYIKRKLQVKDFLNFIPGHGGLLDRLDSILPSSIMFLTYLLYFS